jgi:hypothetical protein
MKESQLLTPLRKRHVRLRDEEPLRRPFASPGFFAELLERALLAWIGKQIRRDAKRARVARLWQLQRRGARRVQLVNDHVDDAALYRCIPSQMLKSGRMQQQLFQKRRHMEYNADRRKMANESWKEI